MQKPPKVLTPLGIIFLFVALAETVLGIAITQTTSWIQRLLAVFACLFPTGVASAFFYILYHRPENFYAPKDFSGDESYLETMREVRAIRLKRYSDATIGIQNLVEERVRSVAMRPELSDPGKREEVADDEAEKINKAIEESLITVDCKNFDVSIGIIALPIAAYDTVDDLTDEIYFAINDHVRPFAYGKDWVMREKGKTDFIRSRRMIDRIPVGVPAGDKRSLADVGIVGGMKLEVIPPK